jgi:hypothetical protein
MSTINHAVYKTIVIIVKDDVASFFLGTMYVEVFGSGSAALKKIKALIDQYFDLKKN